ncbi:alpha/beta hydrolase [Aquibium sp. LZ166]|uniref:Alpha/beta hydrolase n=1 Tax=Aquibium pacificus TaxID=3153579 RepID=A0ABV3SQH8_9HYPH
MTNENLVETSHAGIAVTDNGADGPTIVFIHGNSGCKEVFREQFSAGALAGYRLVAFDLPGHGASEDARDPLESYKIGGYAALTEELLGKLGVERPLLVGWSLGGHVALEMIGRGYHAAGVAISGTPPIQATLECLMSAFNIDPSAENLTGKRDFTDADALTYATHTSGTDGGLDAHFLAMVKRTDGRAREIMFGSVVAGEPLDEQAIVASMTVPLAIVNGATDPFIRADYFDTLSYGSLWNGRVVRIEGAGHAPFLQAPGKFNALLADFAAHAHERAKA